MWKDKNQRLPAQAHGGVAADGQFIAVYAGKRKRFADTHQRLVFGEAAEPELVAAKQFRQAVNAVSDFLNGVHPHYAKRLQGSPYCRIAVGEHRVINRADQETSASLRSAIAMTMRSIAALEQKRCLSAFERSFPIVLSDWTLTNRGQDSDWSVEITGRSVA